MEVQTTVKNFVHDMTRYRIPVDTKIRVVIDESHIHHLSASSETLIIPQITPIEQRKLLNDLPLSYEPKASEELIAIIESSRINTDGIKI